MIKGKILPQGHLKAERGKNFWKKAARQVPEERKMIKVSTVLLLAAQGGDETSLPKRTVNHGEIKGKGRLS